MKKGRFQCHMVYTQRTVEDKWETSESIYGVPSMESKQLLNKISYTIIILLVELIAPVTLIYYNTLHAFFKVRSLPKHLNI